MKVTRRQNSTGITAGVFSSKLIRTTYRPTDIEDFRIGGFLTKGAGSATVEVYRVPRRPYRGWTGATYGASAFGWGNVSS